MAKGRTTLRNDWLRVAPSTAAASSRSLGIVSRYPFRFQMANGSSPEITAKATPTRD